MNKHTAFLVWFTPSEREHNDFHAAKHTCVLRGNLDRLCPFCLDKNYCDNRHSVYCHRHMWE